MADYWMKLYVEILDDPKMATLPDRLWRRIIEVFLVAKRLGKDGHLPDTRQIAWLLRMNPDDLELDLSQISQTGIIIREVNGWFIPKFAQRQAAVADSERKAQERTRKQSQQYYEDVTNLSRNVTQSTEDRIQNTDTETEAETKTEPQPASGGNVFKQYENNIGLMTPLIADNLKSLLDDYPEEWIIESINIATEQNKRTLAYMKGILRKWQTGGFKSGAKKENYKSGGDTKAYITGAYSDWVEH